MIAKGYVCKRRWRSLDADGNPTNDWSEWIYKSAMGSAVNPTLYTSRCKALQGQRQKEGLKRNPIYSDVPRYSPESGLTQGDWFEDVYQKWLDTRKPTGYRETEIRVVEAILKEL